MPTDIRSWFNYFYFDASVHSGESIENRWLNMEQSMAGVLEPRAHYHLIHEFAHAISSASPIYLAMRILRLDAMLTFGSLENTSVNNQPAIDLTKVHPKTLERCIARFLAADVLQGYYSPIFEGIACFSELNVTPSEKTYAFFRPISDLFAVMESDALSPKWRSTGGMFHSASSAGRIERKREVLENPQHRLETRLMILNEPIQDETISGGYLLGYNWINTVYADYQYGLDPEEFVYVDSVNQNVRFTDNHLGRSAR